MDNIRAIEICKNLRRTIDTMTDTTVSGESSIGSNPWATPKPSKNKLMNKLLLIMKKNNITHEQIK
tara:strand:+ start:998 stop:1195 length:198 start_codon:yes stop_codon:yes gene_type:complete